MNTYKRDRFPPDVISYPARPFKKGPWNSRADVFEAPASIEE